MLVPPLDDTKRLVLRRFVSCVDPQKGDDIMPSCANAHWGNISELKEKREGGLCPYILQLPTSCCTAASEVLGHISETFLPC